MIQGHDQRARRPEPLQPCVLAADGGGGDSKELAQPQGLSKTLTKCRLRGRVEMARETQCPLSESTRCHWVLIEEHLGLLLQKLRKPLLLQ